MALGEMTAEQSGEVRTAETLNELREYYLQVCAEVYGERLLLERTYRALDIMTGDELNPDYSWVKPAKRSDFLELSKDALTAEIDTLEVEYRQRLKERKELEVGIKDLIKKSGVLKKSNSPGV